MAPSERQIWVDGELVPWAEATVHILSHSFQRGTLVFDYLSVHETERGSAIFRLREHLERLRASCELVGLRLDQDLEDLAEAVRKTVRANPGGHSVKISAYLPSVEVELVPQDDPPPSPTVGTTRFTLRTTSRCLTMVWPTSPTPG